jgi:hypothetical protein
MKKAKVLEHRMYSEITEKEKLLKNIEKVDALSMIYVPSHRQILLTEKALTVSLEGRPYLRQLIWCKVLVKSRLLLDQTVLVNLNY